MALKDDLLKTYLELEKAKKDLSNLENLENLNQLKERIKLLSKKLEELKNKHAKEYTKLGFKPTMGDARYFKFPDKDLIDELRVKSFEKTGRDLSITYNGEKSMFGNDLHLYVNAYEIKGKKPYKLMIGQGLTMAVTIETKKLDDIELLVKFIKEKTGKPINFIYTDNFLEEVTFARMGNNTFYKTKDGKKDYYRFFYELYDGYGDYIRNVIYVGPEMKLDVPINERGRVEEELILPNRCLTAQARIVENLDSFNEQVKTKILSI